MQHAATLVGRFIVRVKMDFQEMEQVAQVQKYFWNIKIIKYIYADNVILKFMARLYIKTPWSYETDS